MYNFKRLIYIPKTLISRRTDSTHKLLLRVSPLMTIYAETGNLHAATRY